LPRSGEIGEQIFDQVEKLVAGGMNRTEAFAKISADSGRRAGTVAANYYRVARKRAGGSLRKGKAGARRVSGAKRPATAAARRGGRRATRAVSTSASEIDTLTHALVQNVQALAEVVKSQAGEVSDLRKRLDGVKKLLG
jgi:hypothetical protein